MTGQAFPAELQVLERVAALCAQTAAAREQGELARLALPTSATHWRCTGSPPPAPSVHHAWPFQYLPCMLPPAALQPWCSAAPRPGARLQPRAWPSHWARCRSSRGRRSLPQPLLALLPPLPPLLWAPPRPQEPALLSSCGRWAAKETARRQCWAAWWSGGWPSTMLVRFRSQRASSRGWW